MNKLANPPKKSVSAPKSIDTRLIKKALQNSEFKSALMSEPKAVIEKELGIHLPENVEIEILEENKDKFYWVLPHSEASSVSNELLDGVKTTVKRNDPSAFLDTIYDYECKGIDWSCTDGMGLNPRTCF